MHHITSHCIGRVRFGPFRCSLKEVLVGPVGTVQSQCRIIINGGSLGLCCFSLLCATKEISLSILLLLGLWMALCGATGMHLQSNRRYNRRRVRYVIDIENNNG